MYAALLIIGFLFGLALALTVGLFYVLSLDGEFKANVRATAVQVRDRVTGRRRYQPAVSGERRVEPDARLRSLQEELRVANRLLDQARAERQAGSDEAGKAAEEARGLRLELDERDLRIASLEDQVKGHAERQEALRQQLAERAEQLARSQRELRDLQTELDVLQSGVDVVNR